ncbi:MAG: YbaN family protein, partial [Anaerovoracaceae bacterium]
MGLKNLVYLVIGLFFFTLGGIGVFLPILPTFPFLLVSAFCFARSSPRLHHWFLGTKLYQE